MADTNILPVPVPNDRAMLWRNQLANGVGLDPEILPRMQLLHEKNSYRHSRHVSTYEARRLLGRWCSKRPRH